jgi:MFS family permease
MWYPAILELEFNMTATAAGVLTGLYGIGQLVGRPVMGWVCDKLTYRLVGIISGLFLGTSFILILVVHSTALRAMLTLEAGFIGAGVMGALWTFTGLIFPSFRGLALGVITSLGYASASLSLILIGYLGDRYMLSTGLKAVCIPATFLAALAFLSTYLVKSMKRKTG